MSQQAQLPSGLNSYVSKWMQHNPGTEAAAEDYCNSMQFSSDDEDHCNDNWPDDGIDNLVPNDTDTDSDSDDPHEELDSKHIAKRKRIKYKGKPINVTKYQYDSPPSANTRLSASTSGTSSAQPLKKPQWVLTNLEQTHTKGPNATLTSTSKLLKKN